MHKCLIGCNISSPAYIRVRSHHFVQHNPVSTHKYCCRPFAIGGYTSRMRHTYQTFTCLVVPPECAPYEIKFVGGVLSMKVADSWMTVMVTDVALPALTVIIAVRVAALVLFAHVTANVCPLLPVVG